MTNTQIKHNIKDSWELFAKDTAIGGKVEGGKPTPLMEVLTRESAPAIEWLQNSFGLDLSLVSQLGGHSTQRTHRGPEKFPGMTITYALMEKLELIEQESQGKTATIIYSAKAEKLIYENNQVVGVEYTHENQTKRAYGPVVLATGGYGADFSENSLLTTHRPDLLKLSTTNGDHCTGDGIKMAEQVGGSVVDMQYVQVHPTGLVDPQDPDAKVKFLAAEALRGVGGLLLDGNGNRFVNELATRDHVSEVMQKNKGPFRLVLNGKSSKEIEWHCKHYVGRGLMKRFTGAELAKEIGCPVSRLEETLRKYNEVAKKGVDEYGKKFFQNVPYEMNDTYHVAIVTPLIHYCMGGVAIATDASVVTKSGDKISGLFAAGETTGGVHYKNRLGGSSLTDCVVFGKVAGESAARYLLSSLLEKGTGVSGTSSGPFETTIQVNPSSNNLVLNISWGGNGGVKAAPSAPVTAAAPTAAPVKKEAAAPAKKEMKTYTVEDVAKHNKETDCWVIVNGVVVDVTHFMAKHPGGKKAILLFAGKDATEEFNMLHDANVIEKYYPQGIIGTLNKSKM